MDRDVQHGGRTKGETDARPQWRTPTFAEYDIVASTEITNCGFNNDGLICQNSGS